MAAHAAESAQGFLRRGWARLSRRKRRTTTAMTMTFNSTDEACDVVEPLPSSNSQPHNTYQVDNQINPSALPNRKNIVNRSMDRLRRSFRKSFSRGSKGNRLTVSQQNSVEAPISGGGASTLSSSTKNSFQQDEASVRAGTCHFQVKYLGSCEVFESRGMQVCENALRHLRERKRATKAILYVSGDSLRVVDQEHSRGLILDQTVEKVSFCAPDRRNDRGFAYICREGATRRWMCHGFQAVKESGERLSHAVGCSFAICLEKKRKREAEIEVFNAARNLAEEINADRNALSRNNQAYSSFRRQLSLSERRQDPQKAIMVNPVPLQRPNTTNEGKLVNLDDTATTNSKPTNSSFDRQQSSFHVLGNNTPEALQRFYSLRIELQNRISRGNILSFHNEPIYEGDDEAWPGCENQFDNASFSARVSREANSQGTPKEQNKENGLLLNGLSVSGNGFTLKPLNSPPGPTAPTSQLISSHDLKAQQAVPSTTTADEWLEKALQPTLTVSASKMQSNPLTNGIHTQLNGTASVLNECSQGSTKGLTRPAPNPQEMDVPKQPAGQSIKYQILEETDVPPHSPPRVASPLTDQIDLFGQPVFNPLQAQKQPQEEPSVFVQLCAQKSPRQNGLIPDLIKLQQSPVKKKDTLVSTERGVDPFDVGWSTQVLQSARQPLPMTAAPRNNPFNGNESATVNV